MNDEQQLLASAYLDGVVTDEERVRAEADLEVMAAVDRLREVRRALAAVESPDRARRDAAVNAALGLFDAETPAPAAPPGVTSLAARRAARWLMPAAAAAAVLIIAGGILATRDGDDGGDDSAASATTSEAVELLDAPEEDQSAADTAPAPTMVTRSAGEVEASATTDLATEAAGTVAAAATTGTAAPEATVTSGSVVITSPQELTEFASAALFSTEYAPTADVARRTCDEVRGRWLGPATYVEDGVETDVEIFLVAADDEVRAVATATSAVLATAPAPQR